MALSPGNLLRSGPLRPEPEEPEAGAGAERGQVTPVRADTRSGEVMVHQVMSVDIMQISQNIQRTL